MLDVRPFEAFTAAQDNIRRGFEAVTAIQTTVTAVTKPIQDAVRVHEMVIAQLRESQRLFERVAATARAVADEAERAGQLALACEWRQVAARALLEARVCRRLRRRLARQRRPHRTPPVERFSGRPLASHQWHSHAPPVLPAVVPCTDRHRGAVAA
ncbi:MAG TPA: hypothetical protein VLL25_20240 [Acidimicrobiales bacterium]|nr:hypothetical protein [Acidimicrobiales bacterium]